MAGKGGGFMDDAIGMTFRAIIALMVFSFILGVVGAEEKLGPDGFPVDWNVDEYAPDMKLIDGVEPASGSVAVSPTRPSVLSVDQMKKAPTTPLPLANVSDSRVKGPVGVVTLSPVSMSAVVSSLTPRAPALEAETLDEQADAGLRGLASYGPLQPGSGGVASDVWQDYPRRDVDLALEQIGTVGVDSPALREVVRRLLLTRVVPPDQQDKKARPHWLNVRAEHLFGMGLAEAAYSLWKEISPAARAVDDNLAMGWTKGALLAGDTKGACAGAREQAAKVASGAAVNPFWRQVVMVCQVIDGQSAALGLSLQVVDEDFRAQDPILVSLLEAVEADKTDVDLKGIGALNPLQAAVFAAYPALVNDKVVGRLPDIVLRRLVQSTALPLDLRAMAAEELVQLTRLPADGAALQVLYKGINFGGLAQDKDPLGTAKANDKAVMARALLWQVATDTARDAGLRALAWQRWRERAEASGLVGLAMVLGPVQAGVKPAPDLMWLAADGVRIALSQKDDASAKSWLALLKDRTDVPVELVKQRSLLEPLMALVHGKIELAALTQWQVATQMATPDEQLAAVQAIAVLGGFGMDIPQDVMQQVQARAVSLPDGPSRTLWRGIVDKAVDGKRYGLALLETVKPAVGHDVRKLDADYLQVAVGTLRKLGMEDVARQLAFEVLGVRPVVKPVEPVKRLTVGGVKVQDASGTVALDKGKKIGAKPVGKGSFDLLPPPRVDEPTINKPFVKKPSVAAPTAPKM